MTSNQVLWRKVWAIAGVEGAITLSWVIYNLYFPILLMQFGLSKELAITILIIENALESVIEPIFGGLSDRHQRLFGSKISLISIGIVLSSILLITLPSLVIFNLQNFFWRWTLPVLAVLWASAMAIFRAPTISLLKRCAPKDKLPQAASILTMFGGVIGALRFDAFGVILSIGAGFAFTISSITLLIAAVFLRSLNLQELPTVTTQKLSKVSLILLSLVFTLGILMSWCLRFLLPVISHYLTLQYGQTSGKLAMTIFLIILGFAALPAGKIASKFGNFRILKLSSAGTICCLLLLLLADWLSVQSTIGSIGLIYLCGAIIIFYSPILNGIIPYILNLFSSERAGLATGMYFGGFGAGMSIYDLIINPSIADAMETKIGGAIVSLIVIWFLLRNN